VFRFYLHVLLENFLILGKFSPIFIHINLPIFCPIFRKFELTNYEFIQSFEMIILRDESFGDITVIVNGEIILILKFFVL
jgi:hypothetical protein